MIRLVVPFFIGATMATGFALSGVTRPEVIVSFLDFAGRWDPSMMVVMATAVAITFSLYRWVLRRSRPILDEKFMIPTRRDIDTRLIAGSAAFGLGWGLVGLCPGPALASLATGSFQVFIWLASVVGGMYLFSAVDRALQTRSKKLAARKKPPAQSEVAQTLSASA